MGRASSRGSSGGCVMLVVTLVILGVVAIVIIDGRAKFGVGLARRAKAEVGGV